MTHEVFFRVCYNMYSDEAKPPELVTHHGFLPAVLHGYKRHRVRFADYPGIVTHEGGTVRGVVVSNITEMMAKRLDWFEGDGYRRIKAKVAILDKVGNNFGEDNREDEVIEVVTYMFTDPKDLEEEEWDFEHFKREKLKNWA